MFDNTGKVRFLIINSVYCGIFVFPTQNYEESNYYEVSIVEVLFPDRYVVLTFRKQTQNSEKWIGGLEFQID